VSSPAPQPAEHRRPGWLVLLVLVVLVGGIAAAILTGVR
jgi:hypothetical protein